MVRYDLFQLCVVTEELLTGMDSNFWEVFDIVSRHIACMKDRYDRIGGLFELAPETRLELGLQDPTNWQMDKLLSIQDQLIEPLLLYW